MVSLAWAAQAQDTTTTTTTTTTGSTMNSGMMASSTPTAVNGKVVRYYVDQSGYVTAMDVDTGNGVQMVRFAPEIGQRLYTTYPVGGTASVYVVGSPGYGNTVVSIGPNAPNAMTMMNPYNVTDIDLLDSPPWLIAGAPEVRLYGSLKGAIRNRRGEVVGLIVGDSMAVGNNARNALTNYWTMSGNTGTMDANGMIGGNVLVQIPPEFRQVDNGMVGASDRVTPLFRGADVTVVGHPIAPRFGAVSSYPTRIAATAIEINHRSVGMLGFPYWAPEDKTLFGFNLFGSTTKSAEEMKANDMGYSTYNGSTMMSTGNQ